MLLAPPAADAQPLEVPASIPDGTLRRIHVPILMYHYISPLPADADQYRVGLTVEPHIFREHIEYLHREGYQTITLYQLYDALLTGAELPPHPIILTFDDGHIDHYTTVFPILREFGFTGTFFIITQRADVNDPNYVNWAQIREMADAGMSMESHTKTHRDLRERDHDFLVYEILGSLESLEAYTHNPIRMFAYPSGRYDSLTLDILNRSPVWLALTTQHGAHHTLDNRLELPRLRVSGNMSAAGLAHLMHTSK